MFPLHEIAEILHMASEDTGLINRVIKFHAAQHMWSQSTNITDGQTDRQTDVIRWQYRSIAIAWSGKNLPNIQHIRAYNFGARGSNLTKPFHMTCREAGMIVWLQLLGDQPPAPPLKFGGQKRPAFRAVSNNFRFWSRISSELIEISKIEKVSDQPQLLPRSAKNDKLWCTNKNVIGAHVDPPKSNTAGAVYRLMYCVRDTWRCYQRNFSPPPSLNCVPSRTCNAGQPHVGLCLKFLVVDLLYRNWK